MKKLLSFALVLAMVLVLAAPALAITGELATTTTSSTAAAPFLDLSFVFITYKPTTPLTLVAAEVVAANKAYLNYENLYWKLGLKDNTFAYDTVTKKGTTMAPVDYATPGVKISSDVVTLNAAVDWYLVENIGITKQTPITGALSGSDRKLAFSLAGLTDEKSYIFVGQGVVDKTAPNPGYVKCEIMGDINSPKFASAPAFTALDGLTIYSVDKTTPVGLYSFTSTAANTITVTIIGGDYNGYSVKFETDGKTTGNNVTNIYVATKAEPTVFMPVTYVSSVWHVDSKIATDTTVKDAFAAYNQVMSFFGFNYLAEGTLLGKHFAAKLSTYYAVAQLPVNLYTAVVTIPDTATPPKTGDNASVLGFVMVAAAVMAVIALGYKKVRE